MAECVSGVLTLCSGRVWAGAVKSLSCWHSILIITLPFGVACRLDAVCCRL